MKRSLPAFAAAYLLSAVFARAEDSPPAFPEGPPATVAAAAAEGKYAGEDGAETEISSLFDKANWGQILAKLAGDNKITWTQTKPNADSISGVQAGFTPAGAPPEISVTTFFFSGPDGVRFDRLRFAQGEESREKAGLDAIKTIAEGYRQDPPDRKSTIGILNKNQIRQLILGCLIYAADHDGAFPPDIDALLAAEAIEEIHRWRHPETDVMSDFLYHGAGKTDSVPNTTVIFAAPIAIGGKRTIAQADGAVIDIPEADYQKAVSPK